MSAASATAGSDSATVAHSTAYRRIATEEAEISSIPSTMVDLDVDNGKKMLRLRDILDENEDIQEIYANDNIPEAAMA